MTCYRISGRKLTMHKSFCNECQSVEPYKVDAAGEWFCRTCGFAIECVECGQTMTAGHTCRTLHENGTVCEHDCDECHDQGFVTIAGGITACPECARRDAVREATRSVIGGFAWR